MEENIYYFSFLFVLIENFLFFLRIFRWLFIHKLSYFYYRKLISVVHCFQFLGLLFTVILFVSLWLNISLYLGQIFKKRQYNVIQDRYFTYCDFLYFFKVWLISKKCLIYLFKFFAMYFIFVISTYYNDILRKLNRAYTYYCYVL